jgi:hypothetical protein
MKVKKYSEKKWVLGVNGTLKTKIYVAVKVKK